MGKVRCLILLLLGCGLQPQDEEVFTPPSEYKVWYDEVTRCAWRMEDYSRIVWIKADLEGYAGYRKDWKVWIDRDYLADQYTVQHEQLHVLIGDPGHTRMEWGKCLGWGPSPS